MDSDFPRSTTRNSDSACNICLPSNLTYINHKNRRGQIALRECALYTHYQTLISNKGRATRLATSAGADRMIPDNDSMLPIELVTLVGNLVIVVKLYTCCLCI